VGTNGSDPATGLEHVARATEHLLDTAQDITGAQAAAPSLLPGWTRGHVLTHLARNADGLSNLLTWARTGEETPMYASQEARDADIQTGAGRPAAELLDDLRSASERFAEATRTMPADAWSAEVRRRVGKPFPAIRVLWFRLQEVQIHHVDLDAGFTPAHWPADFVARCLDEVARHFGRREDFPALGLHAEDTDRRFELHAGPDGQTGPTIAGPGPALLAWLIGRSSGDGLDVEPDGPLPALPAWG
jgi:maleylpyruvate isomerase